MEMSLGFLGGGCKSKTGCTAYVWRPSGGDGFKYMLNKEGAYTQGREDAQYTCYPVQASSPPTTTSTTMSQCYPLSAIAVIPIAMPPLIPEWRMRPMSELADKHAKRKLVAQHTHGGPVVVMASSAGSTKMNHTRKEVEMHGILVTRYRHPHHQQQRRR